MSNQTATPLQELLNFDALLSQPRLNEVKDIMDNLFVDAKVLASADEEDSGYHTTGYIYQLSKGVAIVSDRFSSSSRHNTYEHFSDEQYKIVLSGLVNSAKMFLDVKEAFLYLRKSKQDNATYFEMRDLIDPLIKNLYKNKVINLHEILEEV